MSRTPKHLREMDFNLFKMMNTGFARFQFGFAEPGDRCQGREFVGNFNRKKDAVAARDACGGTVNPYLNGRLARGWAVWKDAPSIEKDELIEDSTGPATVFWTEKKGTR